MSIPFTPQQMETFKETGRKGLKYAVETIDEHLDSWRRQPLTIGVVGRPGVGKSSYINAIRGLTADDVGGADVGTVHTTLEPTKYPDPKHQMLVFYDLPGIGAENFERKTYLQNIDFENYDCFLILAASRFEENDLWIAKEIQKQGKEFLFARTKISDDYHSQKLAHPKKFREIREKLVETVMDNIKENLGSMFDERNVFVIDNYHFEAEYEPMNQFAKLQERIIEIFPEQKQASLVRSFSVASENIIEKRAEQLEKEIKWVALKSAAIGAIPIPGVSVVSDVSIVASTTKRYYRELGLDNQGLQMLATRYGADLTKLKELVKSSKGGVWRTKEGIMMLTKSLSVAAALDFGEEGVKTWLVAVPAITAVVGASASFASTNYILKHILEELKRTAVNVLRAAVGQNSIE